MRLPAVLLLASVAAHVDGVPRGRLDADIADIADVAGVADGAVRLAGLGESVPALFLQLVNDALKGRIDAGTIRYDAPSSVVLQEARLLDPRGGIVARVKRVRATLSLSELLSGEIVVSHVELEDPSLDLVLHDGKLNLLEALTPKKQPDQSKPAKATFRIDEIRATRGSFKFRDDNNVTVSAAGIGALASLDIDLARDIVIVDVKSPTIASGMVSLNDLDVPLNAIKAKQVIVYQERIDIFDAAGTAAGARVTASGSVTVTAPGKLALHGFVAAPAGAWPERLKPLPFALPALQGKIDVRGAFADPLIAVDASFGEAVAYGYRADSGRGVVTIHKSLVTIEEGSAVRAGGGVVHAEGTITLPARALELRLRAVDLPLASALQPAKLDPAPRGSISARAHLSGIADGDSPLRIDAHGSGRRIELVGVAARGDVQIDTKLTIKPKLVVIDAASLKGDNIDAKLSGSVFTAEERIAFDINARITDAPRWVAAVPAPITLATATFVGKIAGPYQSVVVQGAATGAQGDAYGVPFDDVSARISASATRVTVSALEAAAAGGRVHGVADIVIELKGDKSIRGVVAAQAVDLALIQASDGADLPLAGIGDAEAVLAGPFRDPTVTVRAAVGGFVVAGEALGSLVARAKINKRTVTVLDAAIDGPVAHAETNDLRLDIEDLGLAGQVMIDRLDLAAVAAAKDADLSGTAFGRVAISGDARAPTLQAKLRVRDLAVGAQRFGSGPVELGLLPDLPAQLAAAAAAPGTSRKHTAKAPSAARPPTPTPAGARHHLVTLAAKLGSDIGVWDATSSFAIERKVINAKVRFSDVDLAPFTAQLGAAIAPLQGFAFGTVEAWGPLDKLSMRTRLRVPEVAVTPYRADRSEEGSGPSAASGASDVPLLRALGALIVEARMDAGELSGRVCAFPRVRARAENAASAPAVDVDDTSPCPDGERIWANVVGSLDAQHGSFDLSVDGVVDERAFEDLVPAIARRGFRVGAKARAAAQLVRVAGEPLTVTAEATLLEATVQPPDEELRAQLQAPAEFLYEDRRVRLERPAHFKTPTGEIDVTVGGAAGEEDIAIDIEGSIALALAKLFSEQIANARGTAQTELSIRGRYDEGVQVEGSITPAPGAVITPRALGQPIQFLAGTISFAPAPSSGPALLRISADAVKAKVGDGEAQLRGSVDARTAREADQGLIARWNLAVNGSGLSVRLPSGRIEGGADVVLVGDETAPVLRGRVEINDGFYRKKLELRNFVLASAPGKASEPLWQTLAPIGLAELQLDVAVALQNFRVRANVASFDADMLLRGNLRVGKMLRLPVIDGAIEVEEGEIAFPKARFEVIEMQVEFPSTGDGRLNPLVHLTARAEIPPGAAGSNDTEIPVDLYLDGDLEQGINLDLFATDPVRQWSRNDLLGLILFGKSVEQTVADRDVSLAFNALLNEASAPFTAELENLARETFGVDVEIAATGWRWQLGRRLQMEGEVSLIANDAVSGSAAAGTSSTTAAAATGASTATSSDTLRLRLLIIDHLQPIGRNLSLEARNSALGSDLRLSLRIFEE